MSKKKVNNNKPKNTNKKVSKNLEEKQVKKISEEKPKKKNNLLIWFVIFIFTVFIVVVGIISYKTYNLAANKIIREQLVSVSEDESTPKSGLFIDTLETGYDVSNKFSSKYYFKGKNPNNYLIFENACWRIIHITQNDLLKIVHMGKTADNTCNNIDFKQGNVNNNSIVWGFDNNNFLESSIKNKLTEWSSQNNINNILSIDFTSNDSKVALVEWNIGTIDFKSTSNSLNADILDERKDNNFVSKLGLISVTDYLKAGCKLGSFYSNSSCKDNNYLYSGINYWTLIGEGITDNKAWAVVEDGSVNTAPITDDFGIYPVIYLNSDIKITGKGTAIEPYVVK